MYFILNVSFLCGISYYGYCCHFIPHCENKSNHY